MSSETIHGVAYDNYDDFHKISFHYFVDYLMAKLTRMLDTTPNF
jgi:hypothetical protein